MFASWKFDRVARPQLEPGALEAAERRAADVAAERAAELRKKGLPNEDEPFHYFNEGANRTAQAVSVVVLMGGPVVGVGAVL
jgi:hypothetical protein